jgi:hypothetical protein
MVSLAVDGYETIFCQSTAKTFLINFIQDDLSSSTNARILLLNQSTFFRTRQFFIDFQFGLDVINLAYE